MNPLKKQTNNADFAQQFDLLRHRIYGLLNGEAKHTGTVIAFTSCRPGEGVSNVAANFALSLRDAGNEAVLLVDAHIGDQTMRRLVQSIPQSDRSTALEPESPWSPAWEIVRGGSKLDLLLTSRIDGVVEAQENEYLEKVVRQFQGQYDYILLDCPPMDRGSRAEWIASWATGVVLVVEAGKVRREVIQRRVALLRKAGANLLGVVLNKRQNHIPAWLYRML